MTRVHNPFMYGLLLLGTMACSAGEEHGAASDRCDRGDGGITRTADTISQVSADNVNCRGLSKQFS